MKKNKNFEKLKILIKKLFFSQRINAQSKVGYFAKFQTFLSDFRIFYKVYKYLSNINRRRISLKVDNFAKF